MMQSKKRIAVLGEAMLELSHKTETNLNLSYAGDTLNFALYLRRLLPFSAFDIQYITGLGCDPYSDAMIKNWQQEGLNTDLIYRFKDKLPGLYLIRTDLNGERTFYFYRENSAARELFKIYPSELTQQLLNVDYIYLSGISLAILDDASRQLLWEILSRARKKGIQIIFDTNYRASLWQNVTTAQMVIEKALNYVDLALPTLMDEQALFGDKTALDCAQRYFDKGAKEVVVKCGADPALVMTSAHKAYVTAQIAEKIIDTTGAGDAFNAAYIAARLAGIKPVEATQQGHQLAATVIRYRGAIIPKDRMPNFKD